jgi:hypothetical protein
MCISFMFTPALCNSLPLTTLHGPPRQHLLSCMFVSACDVVTWFYCTSSVSSVSEAAVDESSCAFECCIYL